MSGVSSSTMATLQQWGQILADQQRMVQFNSLLAMTSALPNMTPKVGVDTVDKFGPPFHPLSPQDIAAFCGLQESDLANLAAYTSTIASLSPASLASFGRLRIKQLPNIISVQVQVTKNNLFRE